MKIDPIQDTGQHQTAQRTAILPGFLRPQICELMRIGRDFDGGYLVPTTALKESSLMLSMGINLDWSFEAQTLKKFSSLKLVSFDNTTTFTRSVWWGLSRFAYSPISRRAQHLRGIIKPLEYLAYIGNPRITHIRKHVGTQDTASTASVKQIASRFFPERGMVFVKMDIEGAEYDVLPELLPFADKISAIAIEFHQFGSLQPDFSLIRQLLTEFTVAHLHVNNAGIIDKTGLPELVEISFLNKRLAKELIPWSGSVYRHSLDQPNVSGVEEVCIRFRDD